MQMFYFLTDGGCRICLFCKDYDEACEKSRAFSLRML